jgi:hypothetical protein
LVARSVASRRPAPPPLAPCSSPHHSSPKVKRLPASPEAGSRAQTQGGIMKCLAQRLLLRARPPSPHRRRRRRRRPASGPLLHSLLQQKQEQQTRTQPEQPGRPVLLLTAPVPAHPRPFARPPRRQAGLRALLPMVASAADPLRVMPRPQRSALARPSSPASWAADLRVRAPASRPPRSGPLRRQAGQAARLTRARASALRATCRPRAGRREPVQMSWSKRPCQLGPRRPPNRWRTRADDWTATWAGPTGWTELELDEMAW